MRRTVLVVLFVCGLMGTAVADPSAGLYTLVVPESYTSLYLSGSSSTTISSDDVVQFNVNFSTPSAGLFLGADASYDWYEQTDETTMSLPAFGSVNLTGTLFSLNLNASPFYRSYTLDFNSLLGFWGAGADITVNPVIRFAGGSTFSFSFFPFAEAGVNRIHSIATLKRIETIMRHLGITPTTEMIRAVAEIMYTSTQRLNKFTDDYSENYHTYYQAIANAMGIPTRALDIVLINNSQEYLFDVQRYSGLRHGWEAAARFTPGMEYAFSTFDFKGSLLLRGAYARFLMEDMLHLGADGHVRLAFETDSTPKFFVVTEVSATVTYLPEDFRWWAMGKLGLEVDSSRATDKFGLDLQAKLNYLINPNFTVYGGLLLATRSDRLSVFAGGQIRLW